MKKFRKFNGEKSDTYGNNCRIKKGSFSSGLE